MNIIGQRNLIDTIDDLIFHDSLPRFIILTGVKGSGKKHISYYIAKQLNIQPYEVGTRVEDIRQMIKDANKIIDKQVYIISDTDTMSINAKNALLKICEEPCHNAYIIMTISDLNNTLDTIKSRACIFHTEAYSQKDLRDYIGQYNCSQDEIDMLLEICETPGEIDICHKMDIADFMSYVNKVVDNVADVSLPNALKIADKIAFKDEEGYPIDLFLKAFKSECGIRMRESVSKNDIEMQLYYSAGLRVVNKYIQQLSISGINKSALFDMFIMSIREEWE